MKSSRNHSRLFIQPKDIYSTYPEHIAKSFIRKLFTHTPCCTCRGWVMQNTSTQETPTIPTSTEQAQMTMLRKFASGFTLYLYYLLKMVEALTQKVTVLPRQMKICESNHRIWIESTSTRRQPDRTKRYIPHPRLKINLDAKHKHLVEITECNWSVRAYYCVYW